MSLPHHRNSSHSQSSSGSSSINPSKYNSSYSPNMAFRGNSNNNSINNSYFGSREHRIEEANRNLLEQENDRKWEELGSQVSLLKSLSIDINKEVKSQNDFLDGMGNSFRSASDMFEKTMSQLGVMLGTGNSTHMYVLVIFVVLVFLIIYFMMRK